jgi:hypothetical protein
MRTEGGWEEEGNERDSHISDYNQIQADEGGQSVASDISDTCCPVTTKTTTGNDYYSCSLLSAFVNEIS